MDPEDHEDLASAGFELELSRVTYGNFPDEQSWVQPSEFSELGYQPFSFLRLSAPHCSLPLHPALMAEAGKAGRISPDPGPAASESGGSPAETLAF